MKGLLAIFKIVIATGVNFTKQLPFSVFNNWRQLFLKHMALVAMVTRLCWVAGQSCNNQSRMCRFCCIIHQTGVNCIVVQVKMHDSFKKQSTNTKYTCCALLKMCTHGQFKFHTGRLKLYNKTLVLYKKEKRKQLHRTSNYTQLRQIINSMRKFTEL